MTQKTGNPRGLDEMATGPLPVKPTWEGGLRETGHLRHPAKPVQNPTLGGNRPSAALLRTGLGGGWKKISGGKTTVSRKKFAEYRKQNQRLRFAGRKKFG